VWYGVLRELKKFLNVFSCVRLVSTTRLLSNEEVYNIQNDLDECHISDISKNDSVDIGNACSARGA
jgi:hypothetical protein